MKLGKADFFVIIECILFLAGAGFLSMVFLIESTPTWPFLAGMGCAGLAMILWSMPSTKRQKVYQSASHQEDLDNFDNEGAWMQENEIISPAPSAAPVYTETPTPEYIAPTNDQPEVSEPVIQEPTVTPSELSEAAPASESPTETPAPEHKDESEDEDLVLDW